LVISISASPFHIDKLPSRHAVAAKTARYLRSPLVYANMTGGQDELVFDGGSFIVNERGRIAHQFPPFSEGLYVAHVPGDSSRNAQALSPIDQTHEALIIGLRDYVNKNGFKHVALGLSGGIDSALVATLAVEALGSERVTAVTMPSRHNSKETYGDAILLAKNLGIELLDIAIQPICDTFFQALASAFKGTTPNIAEENIQARVRGTLLMALSNKFGWLILTTGNKSETSTGYCTLYGDTAGGFAVLKDVLKTTVFALSRRINENAGRSIIPETTLLRRPTAELKENQFDEDSLGAYTQLDPIIVHYVEENNTLAQIRANTKADPSYLSRIISLVDRNEYKRRQAPPGIKITSRSFGRDHRMPITNRYRER
jgi:NAD+ synthase (glutamine-hydrolysing)